ncbi:hypothetical protein FDC58_16850 [Clostridium botulinum]|uniref:hypothetical protein n=1 Tax=Clostridium cagae TaxID=2080751 RepID=UPI000CF66DB9|nr:hypothetical protein [Clostridium cagae]NFO89030.1 hypothetical protein [Clostridium botulinum]NFP30862.1 hypothetical protein [Clostridium botulinum]
MSKEITMTFNQFFEMERGILSLDEIVQANNLETIAGEILKNNRLRRCAVTFIALVNSALPVFAEEPDATIAVANIHRATNTLLDVLQEGIYSLCILGCVMEIGKAIVGRRKESIPNIIFKYILAFGAIYFLPWIFDLIKLIFSNK